MTDLVLITLKIPMDMKRAIDELVRTGKFKSASEAVRRAIEEILKKYGVESLPPPPPRMEPSTKKAVRRLAELCQQEPWVCLSTRLMMGRGFSGRAVYLYTRLHGLKYVHGLREDFYRAMAGDIAAYIVGDCGRSRYAHVKPKHVLSAVGLTTTPPNLPIAVSYAMSLLPHVERIKLHTSVIYIYRCEELQQWACDAKLSTVLYAYYAKKNDETSAKLMYERFKHCLK